MLDVKCIVCYDIRYAVENILPKLVHATMRFSYVLQITNTIRRGMCGYSKRKDVMKYDP